MEVVLKRVYRVTFMEYTNDLKDTIRSDDDLLMIELPKDSSTLVFEEDLDLVRGLGGGIRTLEYVGDLLTIEAVTLLGMEGLR